MNKSSRTESASVPARQNKKTPFFKSAGGEGFFPKASIIPGLIQRQVDKPNELEKLNSLAFSRIGDWLAGDKFLEPSLRAIAKAYIASQSPTQRMGWPDRHLYGTPYGNRVIEGFKPLTEDQIVLALKPHINTRKIGKGNKPEDWNFSWAQQTRYREKTGKEMMFELGKVAGNKIVDDTIDAFIEQETKIKQAGIKIVMELLLPERGLMTAFLLASGAETILTIYTVYEFADLLLGFSDKVIAEASPEDRIVNDIRAFLKQGEDAADAAAAAEAEKNDFHKSLQHPTKEQLTSPLKAAPGTPLPVGNK
jgi:hypothetical protein